jgi:adenosylhomocysteine nucleosidase
LASEPIGVVVGLKAEARIARRLGWRVAVGGGSAAGATRAARTLLAEGMEALVSFGLAGGLAPALRPGDIVIPAAVLADGRSYAADPSLRRRLRGLPEGGAMIGAAVAAITAGEKAALFHATRALAVDLESGAVAREAAGAGRPFGVLRAVCDPAGRSLPPLALAALSDAGSMRLDTVLASLARHPWQLPALLALGRDAAAARRALLGHVEAMRCGR